MEYKEQISGELLITFHTIFLKSTDPSFSFIIQRNALLMYHKFDYKLQK